MSSEVKLICRVCGLVDWRDLVHTNETIPCPRCGFNIWYPYTEEKDV